AFSQRIEQKVGLSKIYVRVALGCDLTSRMVERHSPQEERSEPLSSSHSSSELLG
ncbi:hypothetical protein J6590_094563, partial [Homalodisca vitripennis]